MERHRLDVFSLVVGLVLVAGAIVAMAGRTSALAGARPWVSALGVSLVGLIVLATTRRPERG